MNEFFDPVLSQLEAGLESAQTESNLVRRYDRCLRLVKTAITELKHAVRSSPFAGKEEEIHYFRDQAPVIYSRLFYFIKLRVMEAHRVNVSRESWRQEVEREMLRIEEVLFSPSAGASVDGGGWFVLGWLFIYPAGFWGLVGGGGGRDLYR